MNYTFPKLLVWVDQTLAPAELSNRDLTSADFDNWNSFFKTESAEWRMQISSFLLGTTEHFQKKQYLQTQQQQLVNLSNQVNKYLFKNHRLWSSSSQAVQIKSHYRATLSFFEELLSYAEQHFAEYYDPTVKITDFRLQKILPCLRSSINGFKSRLNNSSNVDPELTNILIKAVNRISVPGKLSIASVRYITKLIRETESLGILDQNTLMNTLICLNFNQPECYLYYANRMKIGLQQIDGLHEELDKVIQQRENLRDKRIKPGYSLHPGEPSLKQELQQFFDEKIAYLERLAANRRQAMRDKFDAEHAFKILIDMTVPQFALFLRVFKETQIILRMGMTEICSFFAMHFYTEKAPFISANNLLKRSSDIEFTSVLKLWDMLTAMLDWLDKNFNVRDYRRSL